MKNMKSPGSDGITAEFYKLYWNEIKLYYIESINYSFEHGSLTELQKQGIITLLLKQDKKCTSNRKLETYFVIKMSITKIATKTIANRIKKSIRLTN